MFNPVLVFSLFSCFNFAEIILIVRHFTNHHCSPNAREAKVENDFHRRHKDANIDNREKSTVQSLSIHIGLLLVGGGLVADVYAVVGGERGGDTLGVHNSGGIVEL